MIATVAVEFTDRSRHPAGITEPDGSTFVTDTHYVSVLCEDDDLAATLMAHDLVNAILPRDSMITRTTILDVDKI